MRNSDVASCRPLTKYAGEEDGSKFLCQVHKPGQLRRDCIVYSLGSNVSGSSALGTCLQFLFAVRQCRM
jgi:hypothetical protein